MKDLLLRNEFYAIDKQYDIQDALKEAAKLRKQKESSDSLSDKADHEKTQFEFAYEAEVMKDTVLKLLLRISKMEEARPEVYKIIAIIMFRKLKVRHLAEELQDGESERNLELVK